MKERSLTSLPDASESGEWLRCEEVSSTPQSAHDLERRASTPVNGWNAVGEGGGYGDEPDTPRHEWIPPAPLSLFGLGQQAQHAWTRSDQHQERQIGKHRFRYRIPSRNGNR
jgi:hypothetical protein